MNRGRVRSDLRVVSRGSAFPVREPSTPDQRLSTSRIAKRDRACRARFDFGHKALIYSRLRQIVFVRKIGWPASGGPGSAPPMSPERDPARTMGFGHGRLATSGGAGLVSGSLGHDERSASAGGPGERNVERRSDDRLRLRRLLVGRPEKQADPVQRSG